MAISQPTSEEVQTFCSLQTIDDVAVLLKTTRKRLDYHLYSPSRPTYRTFTLKKASGGVCQIASPPKIILSFQRKLLQCLTEIVNPREPVHGFVLKRGVVTNARCHQQRRQILNIDVKDFFDSIHFGRVRGVFFKPPFSFPLNVATVLANICCRKGIIPQGAPTSPILSNLICRTLDRDLERLAQRHKCRYTRYADDITFSTNLEMFDQGLVESLRILGSPNTNFASKLLHIFKKHDFRINEDKVRLNSAFESQRVTGLVVNAKVNLPRRFVRNIRAILHDCEKNGLAEADNRFRNGLDKKQRYGVSPPLLKHIRGKLDYLRMVRGSGDPLFVKLALRAQRLSSVFKGGVPISGNAVTNQQILGEAIWIVLAKDRNGNEVGQGTAFSLDKVGVVSAGHVFNSTTPNGNLVDHWEIFKGSLPSKQYRITGIKQHNHLDIVIIQSEVENFASLCASCEEINAGDLVLVVGYPQWFSAADNLSLLQCAVSQIKTISAVDHILTNGLIRGGNSGGPILDKDGRVIGIVTYDSDGIAAPNGGISVKHISNVITEGVRAI